MSCGNIFLNQNVQERFSITKPRVIINTPPPLLRSGHVVIFTSPIMAASLRGLLILSFISFPVLSFYSIISNR